MLQFKVMDINILKEVIDKLFAENKGILAADASTPTMTKRMEMVGIESTSDSRRNFRDMLVTTPGLEEYISGVILYDETIRQKTRDGKTFAETLQGKGILPGIKVDAGAKDMANFPGEKIAEGLDGLRERFKEYKEMGAKFAKWRAVITIGDGIPTLTCINSNVETLARYAALAQEAEIVPIIEPEVVMDGSHNLERCAEVTNATLQAVFHTLKGHKVALEGVILKTNMVLPGKDSNQEVSDEEVAENTMDLLVRSVPQEVPGVVFLSGGQDAKVATKRLNAIAKTPDHPWPPSFSFERALEGPAMEIWKGQEVNISLAQKMLLHRAKMNSLARKGEYNEELENEV